MYCVNCGKKTEETSHFCTSCGTPLLPGHPTGANVPTQQIPAENQTVKKRKKIIKIIYITMSIAIAVMVVVIMFLMGLLISAINHHAQQNGISVHGEHAFYIVFAIVLIMWFFATWLLKSATKKNSTGKFIGAFFLDLIPFVLSLNIIPILLVRQLCMLIYIGLFIVMIYLNIKNKKETNYR